LNQKSAKKIELKAKPLSAKTLKWDSALRAPSAPTPTKGNQSRAEPETSGDPGKENFLQDVLRLAGELSGNKDLDANIQTNVPIVEKIVSDPLENNFTAKSQHFLQPTLSVEPMPQAHLDAAQLAIQQVFKSDLNLASSYPQKVILKKGTFAQRNTAWALALVSLCIFAGFSIFGVFRLMQTKEDTFAFFAKPLTGASLTTFGTTLGYKGKNATYFQTMDRLLRNGEVLAIKKHLAKNRPAKIQTEEESLWARSLLARWELMQNTARKPSRLLEKECSKANVDLANECLVHIRALIADKRNEEANQLIKAFWSLSLNEQAPASAQALRLMMAANEMNKKSPLRSLALLQDRVFEARPYSLEAKIQVSKWVLQGALKAKEQSSPSEVQKVLLSKKNDWQKFFESESFRDLSDPEALLLAQLK
jgi:hypothetical protein